MRREEDSPKESKNDNKREREKGRDTQIRSGQISLHKRERKGIPSLKVVPQKWTD